MTSPDGRDVPDEKDTKDDAAAATLWTVVGATLGGLGLLALPPAIILLLKLVRRRRRERRGTPDSRVAGGWDEVLDAARDLGVDVAPGASRLATARTLAASFPGIDVMSLAAEADARVFGPEPVANDAAEAFWAGGDDVIHAMMHSRSRGSRMRAKISLRSLFRTGRTNPVARGRRDGEMGKGAVQ